MSYTLNRCFLLKKGILGFFGAICGGSGMVTTSRNIFAKVGISNSSDENQLFRLWAASCSHVGTDMDIGSRINGVHRESLAEAIRQSEGTNNDGAPLFE